MTTTEKKTTNVQEAEDFLNEANTLAKKLVVVRNRLADARREHAALLAQREDALSEGIDLLPEIRVKHLEVKKLIPEIAQLEQRIHWLVSESAAKLNAENGQIAAQHYMKSRDTLRQAAERFREAFASVLRDAEAGGNFGPSLTDLYNSKLAEIEKILGGVHFSRVTYRLLPLPPLSAELVSRNQVLAAFDNWIAGLH